MRLERRQQRGNSIRRRGPIAELTKSQCQRPHRIGMTADDDAAAPGFTRAAPVAAMSSSDDDDRDAPPPTPRGGGGGDGKCGDRGVATMIAKMAAATGPPPSRDERRRRAAPITPLVALFLGSIVSAAVAVAVATIWHRGHDGGIEEDATRRRPAATSSSSLTPLFGGSRGYYSSLWIEMHAVRDPDDVRLGVEERPHVDGGGGRGGGGGVGRTVTEEAVMNCSEEDRDGKVCTEGNDTGATNGRKGGARGGVDQAAAVVLRDNDPAHGGGEAFGRSLATRPSHRNTQIGHHHSTSTSSWEHPWEHPASAIVPEVPAGLTTLQRSTEENHGTPRMDFFGPYANIRASLDYSYHSNYRRGRQELQDDIIRQALRASKVRDAVTGRVCSQPSRPWIAFTAGAMGVGKSHTIKTLASRGLFPLDAFVRVDPDDVRRHLPEFGLYARRHPAKAGNLTRKEAGYVSEVLTAAALEDGRNVLVDGSLRDWEWYAEYFDRLRGEHPGIRIAILHVRAPREVVFRRAAERSLLTGRVVPQETLEMALEQVPRSVRILAPLSDFFCELNNPSRDDDIQLLTEGVTWESFRGRWLQTCAA